MMRDHYNSRLAKPHFDWPLLIASYMLALYGVFAVTIANYNPNLGSDSSLKDMVMVVCYWSLSCALRSTTFILIVSQSSAST